MIDGIEIEIDPEAVVVRAPRPLRAVSSAAVGGGVGEARALVNLHVAKGFRCEDLETSLAAFVGRRRVPAPWIGLANAAFTDKAALASETADGVTAAAIVTVGLSNLASAGVTPPAVWQLSTINTVVVVDAVPEPAALVNLIVTATEAKVLALAAAGVSGPDGAASGTSSDAVAIVTTDRGPRCRFGGPVTALGWTVARAVRAAVEAGTRRWIEEHA